MVERTPPRIAGPVTYADYLALDDGQRYEVVAGVLYVTPAPVPRHQLVAGALHDELRRWVRPRRLGVVFIAPTDVVLSDTDVVQPDVLFISRARLAIVGRKAIEAAPDLVVEVLSPGTRKLDRGPKLAAYARCGVVEHWLIDAEARTVEVRRRAGEALALVATPTERLETPLLPGFALGLDELFAEGDLDELLGEGELPGEAP
jgi:Uma2 family endonuclease